MLQDAGFSVRYRIFGSRCHLNISRHTGHFLRVNRMEKDLKLRKINANLERQYFELKVGIPSRTERAGRHVNAPHIWPRRQLPTS